MARKIFYSWQATLPNATNRGFILTALEAACAVVGQDLSVDERLEVDRDTQGVPGAPDIVHTIFAKIDEADAFVCDVSIVTGREGLLKPSPNPNVLIELGYAIKSLGWKKIILVMNTAWGGPELLPFDLKTKRATTYEMAVETPERAPERRKLQGVLKAGLEIILQHLPGPIPGVEIRPASSLDEARLLLVNALKVVKEEADRMGDHARQLNAAISTNSAAAYLPLLFRPNLLEATVPKIIDHVDTNQILRDALRELRTTAAAADEHTARVLEGGDLRPLVPLVRNVISSAASVSREIDRLLAT